MEIIHDDYRVEYDAANTTITCHGSFRLRGGAEYKPILDLLIGAADAKPDILTLDVRKLKFLNSSGINTLYKFILQVRKHKTSQVVIKCNSQHPWQQKALTNFKRLLPGLQMEMD